MQLLIKWCDSVSMAAFAGIISGIFLCAEQEWQFRRSELGASNEPGAASTVTMRSGVDGGGSRSDRPSSACLKDGFPVNTALLEEELDQRLGRHAGMVIAFAEARATKGNCR